jgi:hypothetical protein
LPFIGACRQSDRVLHKSDNICYHLLTPRPEFFAVAREVDKFSSAKRNANKVENF